MRQRLALLGATVALSVPVIVSAPAASASSYPSSVKQQYTKSCVKSATKTGVKKKQARAYCSASLKCLQRELSLSDFKEFGEAVGKGDKTPPHRRVIKRCVKEAAKSL